MYILQPYENNNSIIIYQTTMMQWDVNCAHMKVSYSMYIYIYLYLHEYIHSYLHISKVNHRLFIQQSLSRDFQSYYEQLQRDDSLAKEGEVRLLDTDPYKTFIPAWTKFLRSGMSLKSSPPSGKVSRTIGESQHDHDAEESPPAGDSAASSSVPPVQPKNLAPALAAASGETTKASNASDSNGGADKAKKAEEREEGEEEEEEEEEEEDKGGFKGLTLNDSHAEDALMTFEDGQEQGEEEEDDEEPPVRRTPKKKRKTIAKDAAKSSPAPPSASAAADVN